MGDRLIELKEKIKNFSEGAFGKRSGIQASGPLNHLKRELDELLEVLGNGGENEEEEWADCLLLLLDAWRIRYGNWTSYYKFLDMAENKLNIIKERNWNKEPDSEGVFSREGKTPEFHKTYSWEELYDFERDTSEFIQNSYEDEFEGEIEIIIRKK